MKVSMPKLFSIALTLALIVSFLPAQVLPVGAVSTTIVISQVYGGGGNSGAIYKNDFIELYNRGTTNVSLVGWSVQYASSSGTSWSKTNLTAFSFAPGQYYLIQEAAGAGGDRLPANSRRNRNNRYVCNRREGCTRQQSDLIDRKRLSLRCHVVDFVGDDGAATALKPAPRQLLQTQRLRSGMGAAVSIQTITWRTLQWARPHHITVPATPLGMACHPEYTLPGRFHLTDRCCHPWYLPPEHRPDSIL